MDSKVYILLWLFLSQSVALNLDIVQSDKITYEVVSDRYNINMQEEMETPIILGTFVTAGTPTLSYSVGFGPASNLQIGFVDLGSNTFELQILNRQDFEAGIFGGLPQYSVTVQTVVSGTISISLNLVNINDNKPLIEADASTCEIEETNVGLGLTSCNYTITDLDGHLHKDLTLTLSDDGDRFFKFVHEPLTEKDTQVILTLEVIEALDYETATLHIMELTVKDTPIAVGEDTVNEGKARIVVQVIDLPDEPPMWTTIFASKTFDELEGQTFNVFARDGDLGVNDDIFYKMEENSWAQYISINEITGEIQVEPIDRDKENEQIFSFEIAACEMNMPEECITQEIAFLVTDTNNQIPEITIEPHNKEINENFYEDLGIMISATDLDLGQNAMYSITLAPNEGIDHTAAFTVAPSTGYQTTEIYMYVTNYRLLDYEKEDWREFTLTIKTMDYTYPYNNGTAQITIKLKNLNDEIPQFQGMQGGGYTASVNETIRADELVLQVFADDKDVDDEVRYALLGTYINSILAIDEDGSITTTNDNTFDYETQEEVILQVQATDTLAEPYNSAIAQITITVIDVNDETPRITVGPERIEIPENLDHETEIEGVYITATDDDKDADLKFAIDWENTYATKTGARKTEEEFAPYINCIIIETEPINTGGKGKSAAAKLFINEVEPLNTPNYELFDILYLRIDVIDLDQDPEVAENKHSVTVPIYIQDVNDERPKFTESTITSMKRVTENAQISTTIAIIIATDEDSQDIHYFLNAIDDEYEGLLDINEFGEIFVTGDIDADCPPLYNMTFTVTATDLETEPVTAEITIHVLDENDNSPIFEESDLDFYVLEQENDGYVITTLNATDADRDSPNNEVSYQFSSTLSPDLWDYFSVVDDNFIVEYTRPDDKLDRDNAKPGIRNMIIVEALDGNLNARQISEPHIFFVTLLDINNNAPIIETIEFQANENLKEGDKIGEVLAKDKDEENTPNSRIHFEITKIVAEIGKDPPNNLFQIENEQPDKGTVDLIAGISLEGYFGIYKIEIKTYDEGETPQEHTNTITVEIDKYNFYVPKFLNIQDGSKFLLRTGQITDSQLFQYNDDPLEDIFATDQQGDKYSINFSIINSNIFTIVSRNKNQAQLQLKAQPADTKDPFTVRVAALAEDASPILTTEVSIIVQFVDSSAPPIFSQSTQTISFRENTTGLSADFQSAFFDSIPVELIDEYVVFYIIHGENGGQFQIEDNTVNKLAITQVLDRETIPSYTIQIQSSRTADGIAGPQLESILTLTIQVEDINDNPPNFSTKQYFGSFGSTFTVGTHILYLHATDLDFEPKLTYSITGYTQTPGFINTDKPFILNPTSGELITDITVLDNAEGYFLFTVEVSDGEHSDEATVHVYIVSDKHNVEFVFKNDIATISNGKDEILRVLGQEFNYTCIENQIIQNTDENGLPIQDETIFSVHFINLELHAPILKDVIQVYANDIQMFGNLHVEFQRYGLTLVRFLETSDTGENMEEALRAWLIGITVVLGTLCVLLLVAFILKTRSLSRRLNKLSVIRYGSQESVSNRRQAPTTNKHAIEGSNPAYNEDKIKSPENEDTASIDSGDSDLVGVENNPEFDYKYEKQG